MLLTSVFTPLLTFLLFVLFSRYVSTTKLATLTVMLLSGSLYVLFCHYTFFVDGYSSLTTLGNWTQSGLFSVPWAFSIDALTFTMSCVVLSVSTVVHLYSIEYMKEDPHLNRFISYLSLFTFFMMLLISADNFVSLFLGWEGVGLCSYLLISFWHTRVQANKAAIKAMVVNRIADLAFTLGILVSFYAFQSVEFGSVFGLANYFQSVSILFIGFDFNVLSVLTTLLFLGAMGKSAQIGLHTWLPDAMEGPTPVSALIHAATMVTSGIFLIVRCSALFEGAPTTLLFITIIGASTAFMAATAGLVQNDLKKIIAYSTCSQLGYMAFACGLSHYSLALFHLSNHAFFKALLFLSAGAVIHAMSNEQDLRRLGGLMRILPFTFVMFLIGSLALMGFPFLTGFYSKDLILEVAAGTDRRLTLAIFVLPTITAFFTAYYSFRLLDLAFFSESRSPRPYLTQAHELGWKMATSLAFLSLGAIFFGYMARDLFVGFGTPFWNGTIYQSPANTGAQLNGEFIPLFVKLTPLLGSLGAVLVVLVFYRLDNATYDRFLESPSRIALTHFLSHKWYFDLVYNLFIVEKLLVASYRYPFKLIDKGLLEYFGPTGFGFAIGRFARYLFSMQTAVVRHYAVAILAFFVIVFIYNSFSY